MTELASKYIRYTVNVNGRSHFVATMPMSDREAADEMGRLAAKFPSHWSDNTVLFRRPTTGAHRYVRLSTPTIHQISHTYYNWLENTEMLRPSPLLDGALEVSLVLDDDQQENW